MRVDTVTMAADLERVRGPVIILDTFRASNTVQALLAAGAAEVCLLADLAQAYALKAAHPDWLLVGERQGLPPAGFDGGNSPARAAGLGAGSRVAILTTSAGTQAVHRLRGAGPVLFGSFANASALAGRLRGLHPSQVTLLPMGFEARQSALEDDLAADWLHGALLGQAQDFAPVRERLLACEGAQRLRRLGQEDDLTWCTTLDRHDLVPRVQFLEPPRARVWAG